MVRVSEAPPQRMPKPQHECLPRWLLLQLRRVTRLRSWPRLLRVRLGLPLTLQLGMLP